MNMILAVKKQDLLLVINFRMFVFHEKVWLIYMPLEDIKYFNLQTFSVVYIGK